MNAAAMVAACERYQNGATVEPPSHAELVLAGAARWPTEEPIDYYATPLYTTWCHRCEVDHAAPGGDEAAIAS